MAYNYSDSAVLEAQRLKVEIELDAAMLENLDHSSVEGQRKEVADYLNYGVGRRLSVIKLSLRRIYELFPPTQQSALPKETINEVQVYLQAFVMNVSGIFDNWAWAFVLRHDLLDKIGGKFSVGMFLRKTQQCLPTQLKEYVTTEPRVSWHKTYMKEYRDALAHRIPLYVPPFRVDMIDLEAYKQLEDQKRELFEQKDWDELDDITKRQERLGKALPAFIKDFSNSEVYFHPQLNADGALVAEFAQKFYGSWHEFVPPTALPQPSPLEKG